MATISTLAVNLIARTSVFERGMKRSRKSMGAFKKSAASTAINVAAITAAVTTAGFAIRSFTNAASRAQETMNLFNTVFAENSAETAKWANDFAKNVGRSKTEVKEWAATLQDTFVPLGFARDRAAELSKTLVELAVDVGSFKNIASDAEVINSFTSAIVGNHRAVRAYGVVLTNATIEAESFASGTNKVFAELTELEKVQLRFNIIMKSTKDAQGDALKTATNYANRVKKLKGQVEDLKESFGKSLLPAMTKIVAFMNNKMVPMFNRMSRIFKVTIKFLQSNTVKYLAMSSAIVFTAIKIKALIGVIKAIANSYRIFAIAQSVVLSLQGPKGWIILATAIGVATASIVSLNKAMADTDRQTQTTISSAEQLQRITKATAIIRLQEGVAAKQESINALKQLDLAKKKFEALVTEVSLNGKISVAEKKRVTESLKGIRILKAANAKALKRVPGFAEASSLTKLIKGEEEKQKLAKSKIVSLEKEMRLESDLLMIQNERLAQQKINTSGLDSVTGFITDLQQKVDEVGLSQLEAQLQRIDDIGDSLSGDAWKQFNAGTKEARLLITELEAEQKAFNLFEKDIEGAKQLKNSIITTSEARANEIERINGLLAKGLITAKEQQKALANIEGVKQLKESIVTPGEARIKQIKEINELLEKGLITIEEQQKAIANVDGTGELPSGRFQEIRSEFIDVAALNAGGATSGVERNNKLTEEGNRFLRQLVGQGQGVSTL